MEVDYDATNEKIKLNYRRLALVSDRSSFSSFLDGAYKFFLLKNINGNLMKILLSVHRSGIPTSIRVTMPLQKNFNWSMKLIKVIFLFVASQMVFILHASQMTCIPACYMMRNLHFLWSPTYGSYMPYKSIWFLILSYLLIIWSPIFEVGWFNLWLGKDEKWFKSFCGRILMFSIFILSYWNPNDILHF